MKRVQRFRRNDYVGSAIWGIRSDHPLTEGDRVVANNKPFTDLNLIVGYADGVRGPRLACFYADQECFWHPDEPTCRERFCGFIDMRQK